jgi:hypothetical protein
VSSLRIPFFEAINEPKLLKKPFLKLSHPQRAALLIAYGCPLPPEYLKYHALFQERVPFDDFGIPDYSTLTSPVHYVPKEYEQIWGIWGRRAGKTDKFASFVVAYEATCGGHEEERGNSTAVCFLVAQDLKLARQNLPLIRAHLDLSPILSKEFEGEPTADFIRLKNGVNIGVAPPSPKALRGYAVPVVVMDEVGFWYSDAESANPDYEVERAVEHAQGQFSHRKLVGITTPWTKEGLAYKYYIAGTEGCKLPRDQRDQYNNILVLHAPTAAVENPLIKLDWLKAKRLKDPEAFERESLAKFVDSISGFLSPSLLKEAIAPNVVEREPLPRAGHPEDESPLYVAALDPAFRHDAFGFTILHRAHDGSLVQDVVRRWQRLPHEDALNPALILAEISLLLKQYRIHYVFSDQYQLESLQQLALALGFSIEGVDFTSKSKARILGNLQQLVNQKKLKLLDNKEQYVELATLEKKLTPSGGVAISAPRGKHDDLAMVLALACFKAMWMFSVVPKPTNTGRKTLFEKCTATIKRKKREHAGNDY